MIWRRRLVLAITWVVLSIAGIAIVRRLPAIYRAEAVILVESQRIPERFVAPTVSSELKDRLATLSQQILSYSRLLEIVERFDLYKTERADHTQEEVVEMMRGDVGIRLEEGWSTRSRMDNRPSAFRISYQGPNPEVVALVANQVGGLFIDENLRAREVQAVGTSEFLGTQLAEAKKRLEEQEATMSKYKLRYNGELPEQENMLLSTLGQLQLRLQSEKDVLSRAEQNKSILSGSIAAALETDRAIGELADQSTTPVTALGTPADPDAENALALRRRLDRARSVWGEKHPEVLGIRETLERLEAEESAAPRTEAKNGEAGLERAPKPSRASLQFSELRMQRQERLSGMKAQLDSVEQQIRESRAQSDRISKEIAKAEQRLGRIPLREQELATVKRDYEISRANYQSLLDKGMAAELAAEMERRQKAERFTMVDAARVPQKPVKPNRPVLYAATTLISCLLGVAAGLGSEMRRNAVIDERDVPVGVPVLGRIPSIVTYNKVFDIPPKPRRHILLWVFLVLTVLAVGAVVAAWTFGWIPTSWLARLHG